MNSVFAISPHQLACVVNRDDDRHYGERALHPFYQHTRNWKIRHAAAIDRTCDGEKHVDDTNRNQHEKSRALEYKAHVKSCECGKLLPPRGAVRVGRCQWFYRWRGFCAFDHSEFYFLCRFGHAFAFRVETKQHISKCEHRSRNTCPNQSVVEQQSRNLWQHRIAISDGPVFGDLPERPKRERIGERRNRVVHRITEQHPRGDEQHQKRDPTDIRPHHRARCRRERKERG